MSCKLAVPLLLLVLFEAVSAQSGWCNVQSCITYKKGKHTLCAYPKSGSSDNCKAKKDLGGNLSDDERNSILALHNQFRQRVASGAETRGSNGPQPRAKSGRMPNLEWDTTLAAIAQRWADQCNYAHDKCRDVPAYQVGQNIAKSGTTGSVQSIEVVDMVKMWYNEVQYFNRNEVKKFSGNLKAANGKDIGHYTQIVWAETTKIGCGVRGFVEGGFNYRYLVCNYGPSGNFPGRAIYET